MMKQWKDIRDTYAANVRKLTGKSGDAKKADIAWHLWDNMQWFRDYYKNIHHLLFCTMKDLKAFQ